MKVIIAVALCATALIMLPFNGYGHEASAVPAGGLSAALEEALYDDTGGYLCDQQLVKQAREGVEKRYGQRIKNLQSAYLGWHGADIPVNVIRISSCRRSIAPVNKEEYVRRSVEGFNFYLTRLEQQYASAPEKSREP